MVGTILGILKVIGCFILIILSLVIIMVLLTVFVPVRYKANLDKSQEDITVVCKVSWLLHFIHVQYIYAKDTNEILVRVAGVKVETFQKLFQKLSKDINKFRSSIYGKKKKRLQKEEKVETEYEARIELTTLDSPVKEEKESITSYCKGKKQKISIGKRICKIIKKIVSWPKLIYSKIKKFMIGFKLVLAKVKDWKEFLSETQTKEAIKLIKKQMLLVLKHIKPSTLKGSISFGFSDPSLTGKALGVAGIFYPLYGKSVSIIPYFDREILEGELFVKGRVQLFFVLKTVWKLYMDQNIKSMIRRFQA